MKDDNTIEVFGDIVYKIAYGYARNSFDADDIYSETFLRYYRRKRSFESDEHKKAWFIRVTINCAKRFFSKRPSNVSLDEIGELKSDEPTDNAEILALRAEILKLDEDSRNIIMLFYYEDMQIKQISAALAMNENTVKTKLARARKKLEENLRDWE